MANSLRTKLKKLAHDGKINQQELDDLLKKIRWHDRELQEQNSSFQRTINALMGQIQEMEEQIPKWHLVADGDLPNNARQVLIYGMSYHFVIGKYAEMRTEKGYEMKWVKYDAWSYNEELEDVIAWMELPKFEGVE